MVCYMTCWERIIIVDDLVMMEYCSYDISMLWLFSYNMLWLDFSPFLVVVFMVSVPVGYKYLERGDLVVGHLEGCDGTCLPSILL